MRGGLQYQESSDPGQQSWIQNPGGLQINQCCSLNTVKRVLLSFSYLLNNYIMSVKLLLCVHPQELSRKRPPLTFLKGPRLLFRPENLHFLLFSVSGK